MSNVVRHYKREPVEHAKHGLALSKVVIFRRTHTPFFQPHLCVSPKSTDVGFCSYIYLLYPLSHTLDTYVVYAIVCVYIYIYRHSESVLASFTINFNVEYICMYIVYYTYIEKRFEFMRGGGLLTLPPPPPGKSLHEYIYIYIYRYRILCLGNRTCLSVEWFIAWC